MRRADALQELGLETDAASSTDIRKTYLRLAKSQHPDKPGGSTAAFQKLVAAYEFLTSDDDSTSGAAADRKPSPREDSADAETERGETHQEEEEVDEDQYYHYEYGFFYEFHFHFFRTSSSWEESFDEERYERYFEQRRQAAKQRYQKERRYNVKHNIDYRDQKAKTDDANHSKKCMFCGENEAITKERAVESGVNWDEYAGHPDGYQTCWACKNKNTSVLTENMALQKFAKKLQNVKMMGRYGEFNPVFWMLRKDGRSFHHQPKTRYYDGPTRNTIYYWYPDLEAWALAEGWKPRGKQKDEVPWVRKDLSESNELVDKADKTSSPPKKKQKRSNDDG